MRMLVPPIGRRRDMDRRLVEFFHQHRLASFKTAITAFCGYYKVKQPRIEWYQYIDWGRVAGKTFEDGTIHLVHPENWKRGRVYNTERMWVQTVYHELAHYLFWTDAERKAEVFTLRMVRGLKRSIKRPKTRVKRVGLKSARRAGTSTRRGRPTSQRVAPISGRSRATASASLSGRRRSR